MGNLSVAGITTTRGWTTGFMSHAVDEYSFAKMGGIFILNKGVAVTGVQSVAS